MKEKPPFKFSAQTRVGFSDTDAQGIVYYGRYLPYFDLARVEYHRNLGLLGMDIGEEGEEFVMRAASVEYLAPAVFDDLIEVYIRIARIGRTSVTYELAAYRARDDELMVTATPDARPRRPGRSARPWRSPIRTGTRSARSKARRRGVRRRRS